MTLYKVSKQGLSEVNRDRFATELEIQQLVETNVDSIFNLELISSEFMIGDFRLDSLCWDEEAKAFVVIEYKRGSSYSVIDQGYSYLSTMLNNKAEFILEYNEKMDTSLKRNQVDWTQSRVIFVAPTFNSYQKNSVNFKDVPFELWEIKRFDGDLVSLEQHVSSSSESIAAVERGSTAVSKVSAEVKQYDESYHLEKTSDQIKQLWSELCLRLNELEGTTLSFRKRAISLKTENNTVVVSFNLRKSYIRTSIHRGSIYPDGTKTGQYGWFTLDDPKGVCHETKKWYMNSHDIVYYRFEIKTVEEIDYTMLLINQKHRSVLS
tara:strand:- start:875 stop:1837 length:963 start_codon:yes stop_codon:yes gene_type:complete